MFSSFRKLFFNKIALGVYIVAFFLIFISFRNKSTLSSSSSKPRGTFFWSVAKTKNSFKFLITECAASSSVSCYIDAYINTPDPTPILCQNVPVQGSNEFVLVGQCNANGLLNLNCTYNANSCPKGSKIIIMNIGCLDNSTVRLGIEKSQTFTTIDC